MKKIILGIIAILVAAAVFFFLFIYPKTTTLLERTIPDSAEIAYDSAWNYRQSINSCGPYSAAAAIRVATGKDLSSEDIAKHIPWRFHGVTLPFGILSTLHSHNVPFEECIVSFSDAQKIQWLREQIAQKHPVILLGRKKNALHYITALGYGTSTFNVYDSWEDKSNDNLTIDKNGSASGNVTLTDTELLQFWNNGGVLGLYKNYAVVASDVRTTSP